MVPPSLSVTSEFCISGQEIPLQDLGEVPLFQPEHDVMSTEQAKYSWCFQKHWRLWQLLPLLSDF